MERGFNVLQCVRSTSCHKRYALQCVAVCGSVLQRVVVCCSVLYSVSRQRGGIPFAIRECRLCAPCLCHYAASLFLFSVVDSFFFVLQCVAVCCSELQYVAVCCSVLQCVAVCCSVL